MYLYKEENGPILFVYISRDHDYSTTFHHVNQLSYMPSISWMVSWDLIILQ